MLFEGDSPFLAKLDFGPLSARNDRGKQPIHVEGKVVHATQENVGRDGPASEDCDKLFSLGLSQRQFANKVKGLFGNGSFPAL